MSTPASYPESANIFPNRPHWDENGVWVEARQKAAICWCPESSSSASNLCEKCQAIRLRHLVLCEAEGRMVDLGKLNDIVDRPECDFCSLVALASEQTWRGTWSQSGREGTTCFINALEPGRQQPKGYALQLTETAPTDWQWLELEIVFKGHDQNVHRVEKTSEIRPKLDVEFLKNAIQNCEANHKYCTFFGTGLKRPIREPPGMLVMDLDYMCIGPAPSGCRYIALSYVWGKRTGDWLVLTRDNSINLSKVDALTHASLPQTVRDAMHLTAQLGERYLWVDSLCIVQDDPIIQQQQIDIMDFIYSTATMTIVAAAGDNANSGLPGISQWLRTIARRTVTVEDIEISNIIPRMADTVDRSIWNTRGWTYQEQMFSRRCIFLTEAQAYYACSGGVKYERKNLLLATTGEIRRLTEKSRYQSDSLKPYYLKAVEEYTQRCLTNPADILRAFQGVLNDMTRIFYQKFFFGLPNGNFKEGLLWQPLREAEKRFTDLDLPSWSWACMMGPIKHSFTENIVTQASELPAFWLDGQEPERFELKWLLNADGSHIIQVTHPIGTPPSSTTSEVLPGEPPPNLSKITLEKPGRLMFQTQRNFFKLANSVPFRTIDNWWTDYTMSVDFSKRSIASIIHNGSLSDSIGFIELDKIWAEKYLTLEPGLRVWEFIALSLATTDIENDIMHRHFTMRRQIDYPLVYSRNVRALVVNVMLVQRVGDLCTRLGVGKIYLDGWEEAGPEKTWIVLG